MINILSQGNHGQLRMVLNGLKPQKHDRALSLNHSCAQLDHDPTERIAFSHMKMV